MATITQDEYVERETLPAESILLLKIEESAIREVRSQNRDSSWEKLNVKFKILDVLVTGDGSPKEAYDDLIGTFIYGSVPWRFSTSPENKLRQWSEAILGLELNSPGFQLDTDLFDGRQVRGITSTYDKRTINQATGKPYKAHEVSSLLPLGSGAAPTAPQAQQPVAAGYTWGAGTVPSTSGGGLFSDEPPFFCTPAALEV